MKLIVLRGPSGSGKSTVARLLRERLGAGIALVEQDYLGRVVLGRRLTDDGANAGLIEAVTRAALEAAPAVVLEGILSTAGYGDTIGRLRSIPGLESWFYAFDIPFEETLARHAGRDKAGSFGEDELRRWWVGSDPLRAPDGRTLERVIGPESSAAETVDRIIADARLAPGELLP